MEKAYFTSPATTITTTTLHLDIIATHILPKLDGQTLAAAACASVQLHTLCTEEKLWRELCLSTWPSTNDPRVQDAIKTFSSGYRSFFSDSFPATASRIHHSRPSSTSELISAVDIHFQDKLVYSKVEVTATKANGFMDSTMRVELRNPKETVTTSLNLQDIHKDELFSYVEKYLTMSWIMVDPTRNRAVNLSSRRPVSVRRHSIGDDVRILFATVLDGTEYRITVTCEARGVKEVSLRVEDMDGKGLSWKESLVILEGAMESGRRKLGKRERYEYGYGYGEYLEMKRLRRERKEKAEKRMDMVCVAIRVFIFLGMMVLVVWSAI